MVRKVLRVVRREGTPGIRKRARLAALSVVRPAVVTSDYGVRLTANWKDKTFRLYVRGSYGTYMSDFLAGLEDPFVFLDVGANQGLYSILAAKNPSCTQVPAIEPIDEVAALLRANLSLNDCRGVSVAEAAISNRSGSAQVSLDPSHSGTTSLRSEAPTGPAIRSKMIKCISRIELDDMVGTTDDRIVVKIDVEGFEATVLAELASCSFFSKVTDVFCEVDERWVGYEALVQCLGSGPVTALVFQRLS